MHPEHPERRALVPASAADEARLSAPRAQADQAAWSPAEPAADEKPVDIRRYIATAVRYKWMLLALSAAGLAVGVGASRFALPEFRAQATLWIEQGPQRGARDRGPIRQEELLQSSAWVDLLRSFVVLDEVVRQMRLYLEPGSPADVAALAPFHLRQQFRPGTYKLEVDRGGRGWRLLTAAGTEVQRGAPGDSVGAALGFGWVPPARELRSGRDIEFTVRTPREAALKVSQRLSAQIKLPDGNFLAIGLRGSDAELTANTLNAIANRYVEIAANLKREKLTELTRILYEQLQSAYTDLRRAEAALEGFRVNTVTLPTEAATPVVPGLQQTNAPVFTRFFAMRIERDQLARDRDALQRAIAQAADSGLQPVALEAIPAVRTSSELMRALDLLTQKQAEMRSTRLRFSSDYQPLQRLEEEVSDLERRQVPQLVQALITELNGRGEELDSRLEGASRELKQIPPRVIEEARLRRDVTIAENLYTVLQQRYEEARLAEVSSIPDVRILDAAVTPQQPVREQAPQFIAGGLIGGLALAIVLALALDKFDRRLRYPDQVTRELGLTILGTVPRVKNGREGGPSDDSAQVVEALRSIRLGLVHAYGAAGPLITTITSPGSGDGKSFIAANLALAFADAGHRTLLVDGDIRRGALHRILGAQRKPGLIDYLGGQATREQVVQATRITSVDFIGCGTRKMGGPELLASPAMSQLLIGLRGSYGVIIVDSPPLGAGVDPLILGSMTGSVLLVLRNGVTDRELTLAKLELLGRLPIRVLGAVLNDVRATGAYRYYSYLSGYSAEDEKEDVAAAVGPRRLSGSEG